MKIPQYNWGIIMLNGEIFLKQGLSKKVVCDKIGKRLKIKEQKWGIILKI